MVFEAHIGLNNRPIGIGDWTALICVGWQDEKQAISFGNEKKDVTLQRSHLWKPCESMSGKGGTHMTKKCLL